MRMKKRNTLKKWCALVLTAAFVFGISYPTADAKRNRKSVGHQVITSIFSGINKTTKTKKNKKTTETTETTKTNPNASLPIEVLRPELKEYTGPLDPLPPDEPSERPAWFESRTIPEDMSNARLVAEYKNIVKWRTYARENKLAWVDPDMFRHDELSTEISHRIKSIARYLHYAREEDKEAKDAAEAVANTKQYRHAVSSNIEPLYYNDEYMPNPAILPYYHPEVN